MEYQATLCGREFVIAVAAVFGGMLRPARLSDSSVCTITKEKL